MHIYNPVSYRWERDPKGKYAYGATCVKECPEHLLKDNGACVRSCPEKFRVSFFFKILLFVTRRGPARRAIGRAPKS